MSVFPSLLLIGLRSASSLIGGEWELALYPSRDGRYGRARVGAFQLPDFSRAGYRGGGVEIPHPGNTHEVGPLSDENADATAHLQAAIDAAARGVLLILPGTYRVTSELVIPNRTIVRGSGTVADATPTKIIMARRANTANILVLTANLSPATTPRFGNWGEGRGEPRRLIAEVAASDANVGVKSGGAWQVGDWVVVGNRITDALRLEYNGVTSVWPGENGFGYLRLDAGPDGRYHKTINSAQAAIHGTCGYVIGVTRVAEGQEVTSLAEWREGIGREASLRPPSLYDSMLAHRLRSRHSPAASPASSVGGASAVGISRWEGAPRRRARRPLRGSQGTSGTLRVCPHGISVGRVSIQPSAVVSGVGFTGHSRFGPRFHGRRQISEGLGLESICVHRHRARSGGSGRSPSRGG